MADRSPRIRTLTLLNFPKGTLFNRVNFRYTTAVFTLSPEPWALLCGANPETMPYTQIMHFKYRKENFVFNIGLLYFTNIFKSFTQKVDLIFDIFFGIWSHKGLPISSNLFCFRAFEVPKYVYAPSASHLWQTRQLHNPGYMLFLSPGSSPGQA